MMNLNCNQRPLLNMQVDKYNDTETEMFTDEKMSSRLRRRVSARRFDVLDLF
jgi:hypothetical protein